MRSKIRNVGKGIWIPTKHILKCVRRCDKSISLFFLGRPDPCPAAAWAQPRCTDATGRPRAVAVGHIIPSSRFKRPKNTTETPFSPHSNSLTGWWFNQPIDPYCIATWVLQLFLKNLGQNRTDLRDTNPQRWLLRNWKLEKFSWEPISGNLKTATSSVLGALLSEVRYWSRSRSLDKVCSTQPEL